MKIWLWAAAACLFLTIVSANPAVAGSTPPPPKSVTETCEENYNSSSASSTCFNESFSEREYGQCRIGANCRRTAYNNVFSAITLDPDDASSLVNCSGRLRLSC